MVKLFAAKDNCCVWRTAASSFFIGPIGAFRIPVSHTSSIAGGGFRTPDKDTGFLHLGPIWEPCIAHRAPGSPLDQVDPLPSNRNLYRHPPRSGQGGVDLGQVGGCGSRGHLGFFKFAPPAPPIAKSNRGYFDVGASSQGRSTPISPLVSRA